MLFDLNVIHTRSNWLCWKAQEKFQVEFRFCKTIGYSYVTLSTTYLTKKTVFKVSNRNTTKRCLLILKILKTERCHLSTSYLPEVTLQNRILDSLQCQFAIKSLLSFCFQVRRPAISTIANTYMSFYEKWEIITELFNSRKIQNANIFFSEKTAPKMDKCFNFSPSKGRHFSIIKLDILIFCNILHLEMGFWNLSWKRIVSS